MFNIITKLGYKLKSKYILELNDIPIYSENQAIFTNTK